MFHITFVQIGLFDWLSGRQKASIFVKMFKIFFSETIWRMKPKLAYLPRTLPSTKGMFFISIG